MQILDSQIEFFLFQGTKLSSQMVVQDGIPWKCPKGTGFVIARNLPSCIFKNVEKRESIYIQYQWEVLSAINVNCGSTLFPFSWATFPLHWLVSGRDPKAHGLRNNLSDPTYKWVGFSSPIPQITRVNWSLLNWGSDVATPLPFKSNQQSDGGEYQQPHEHKMSHDEPRTKPFYSPLLVVS